MQSEDFYKDEWLSSILGCQAYHLYENTCAGKVSSLGTDIFCDAKCPVEDITTTRLLSQAGFFVVDVNIYLEGKSVVFRSNSWDVRVANSDDIDSVVAIAGGCFSKSRFHLDPYIGNDRANDIKSSWAQNYFLGKRGDLMIVAEGLKGVVGFLQLIKKEDGFWIIDLIGVDDSFNGQGVGGAMISGMSLFCKEVIKIGVGTQVANTNSLAFYKKHGFIQKRAQYVFHYHGGRA